MIPAMDKQKSKLFQIPEAATVSKRVSAIDRVRGLVMIIMALDHVRDLLYTHSLTQNPTDLNTTTSLLFFSRWITHLCAPTFVFLSGVSAWLSYRNATNPANARRRLWKRGLWLIALEFTVINFALWFDAQFRIMILQVIAAIGAGLVLLSALVRVRPLVIGTIAAVIILSHNLLQSLPLPSHPVPGALFNILFRPAILQPSEQFTFFVAYPLIPWIAILLLGFASGPLFQKDADWQKKFFCVAGVLALSLFVLLRLVNGYGDPAPWSVQKNSWYTVLSFINLTKYPPSLLFVLLFLGISFLLLRFTASLPRKVQSMLSVFGRVPLFYYLVHWYLIRFAVFMMVFIQGFTWKDLRFGPFQFGRAEQGSGIGLGGVFIVWLLLVALLYPLCRWYDKYKKRNCQVKPWLRYL